MSLTVFSQLLTRHQLKIGDIGRIEVGSESNPDRAKSIKSHLMAHCGNGPVAGGDCMQACYGGTAALLNTLAWIESSQWDGKLAVIVAVDVAVYAPGPARATGGCGAVAILLGRSATAPIVFRADGVFGHAAAHMYDFYKPDPFSEFPVVDGQLSVSAYLTSALHAYRDYVHKARRADCNTEPRAISDRFDQLIFHSPYAKIVTKAFQQLQLFDPDVVAPIAIKPLSELSDETRQTLDALFAEKVAPSLKLSRNLGNSYCASIFCNLISCVLEMRKRHEDLVVGGLEGERLRPQSVGVFSYGSGSMASFYALTVHPELLATCSWISELSADIQKRLSRRIVRTPSEYEAVMTQRTRLFGQASWKPAPADLTHFPTGTFYLAEIDDKFRRHYRCR